ncbi:FxsA family protein [Nocardioides bizhenqiangii]|uniref:FxsA family protein n=1 Tax=Nocardioides bizhenqiangii TaxID=3095076 RepID=A0ABZ0ZJE9_9ACTN|nr:MULTISPECIES: FxsA family protein [unclassified Nocardioides]MDZ5620182.1 FxsA family protein [Nocardioides sp. HM23]WQQ24560.1 FxsA family protein [Nocardioides sp. HM61]
MSTTRRRRRWLPLILFVAFVVVPLVEIYVVIQVGQAIGAWWTIGLLVLDSMIGAWLVKREGRRAWQALRAALDSYRPPAKELADGALILIGGTLLLTPGFATDVVGFLLVLPFTRPLFRRALSVYVGSRLTTVAVGRAGRAPGPTAGDTVVRGEVVED